MTERMAGGLAGVLGAGAESYQSGGNVYVVLYRRPDGKFVVIGDDGADVYESESDYNDGGPPGPESVLWGGSGR